jgi:ubiquinone/menaquinone biosynthesis C-methylase UbiE
MATRGDSENQAILRDKMIKAGKITKKNKYISEILCALKLEDRLLDIGCGTAHIIRGLAVHSSDSILVGLDVSPAMLTQAKLNGSEMHNGGLVKADGLKLPFGDCVFDVVITRLAEYSSPEVYRVLRRGGTFVEYGLGPEADKEIPEFFPDRFERENFFIPKNLANWKDEACESIKDAGFTVLSIEDHREIEHYLNEQDLMDVIEMVPLVKGFNRAKDREKANHLAEKYSDKKGVKITWHYCIIEAQKK